MVISTESWHIALRIIDNVCRNCFQIPVRDEFIVAVSKWVAAQGCTVEDLHFLMDFSVRKFERFPTVPQFAFLMDELKAVREKEFRKALS